MSSDDLRVKVLLAMQIALLGRITPNIRGITCSWNKRNVRIKYVFESNYSEADEETIEEVITEIMSHLPNHQVDKDLLVVREPAQFKDEYLDAWVYMRKEIAVPMG